MAADRFDLGLGWLRNPDEWMNDPSLELTFGPRFRTPSTSTRHKRSYTRLEDPDQMKRAGAILAIGGAATSAIGAGVEAQAARHDANSAALAAEFDAEQSGISARGAELDAQLILASGQDEIARLTAAHGQDAAHRRATTGGRGVVVDSGSSARVALSERVRAKIDVATIAENTARAAGNARMRATQLRNQSLLSRASARNMRRSARLYDPFIAVATSLMTSAASFGRQVSADAFAASTRTGA